MNKTLFGIATAVSAGLVFWLASSVERNPRVLNRDLVLKILNSVYKSIKPYCIEIACHSNTVKVNSPEIPSVEKLKEILENDFLVNENLLRATEAAYKSFETRKEEVEEYIEKNLKGDSEVADLLKKIEDHVSSSIRGFILEETCYLPYEVNSKMMLDVLSEIYYCELYFVKVKMDMKRNSADYMDDWEIDEYVHHEQTKCKAKVFRKFGVIVVENSVSDVIRQSIRNFSIIDENFKSFHKKLEDIYNEHLSEIVSGTLSKEFEEYLDMKYKFYINLA